MKKRSKIILCISLVAVLVCSMACTAFAVHAGDIGGWSEGGAFVKYVAYGARLSNDYINNIEFALPNTPAHIDTQTYGYDEFLINEEPVVGDVENRYYVEYLSETKRNNGTAVNRVSFVNIDGSVIEADYLRCAIDDFRGVQPRFGLRMDGDGANAMKKYNFEVTVDVPYSNIVTRSNDYTVVGGIRSFTYTCDKLVDNNSLVYPFYDTFTVHSSFSGVHDNVTIQSVIESDLRHLHEQDGVTFGSEQVRYYHDMIFNVYNDASDTIPLLFTTECWPYEESDVEFRFGQILDKQTIIEEVQVRPFDWLVQAGQSALDFQLLPGFTVGHILLVMLAIPILIAVLRLIAGG